MHSPLRPLTTVGWYHGLVYNPSRSFYDKAREEYGHASRYFQCRGVSVFSRMWSFRGNNAAYHAEEKVLVGGGTLVGGS